MIVENLNQEIYELLLVNMKKWQKAYDEGHPEISDIEWDDYYTTLLTIEKNQGFADPNSPSQKIHYDIVNELKKVEHNHPMLSLDKTKDLDVIKSFISNRDWICMAKMDGLTCSLHYRGGRLVRAETRGNGLVGEDITHNAYKIASIPKTIDSNYDTVVDGEIICTYENFEKFNKDYSNPRNFASGSIRLLDSNECAKRGLEFVAWDLINGYDKFGGGKTLSQKLTHLQSLGFITVCWRTPTSEYKETLEEVIDSIKRFCSNKTYPIDGLVFKYDNCKEYEAAGRTDHHFKGGLAYKFYDEEYETELIDIEWTMGRTGVLTPVAFFKPLEIEGATVSRANLHNVSVMYDILGCPYTGQPIWVYRANMIIPQISRARKSDVHSLLEIFVPDTCPVCGGRAEIETSGDVQVLMCQNENCEGKLINKLDHFAGKKGLDIKGLSKATLEKLIDYGWVEKFTDIFNLKDYRKEWIDKPGFGQKSVDRILESIEKSRTCDFEAFISSLGIPMIGKVLANKLVNNFIDYADFRNAIEHNYKFYELDDIGIEKHNALVNYDYTVADELYRKKYVRLNYPSDEKDTLKQNLQGLTFVITGKLGKYYKTRDVIKEVITKRGGRVVESVSSKTTYLINNDKNSTSSKNKTAQSLGIPIISEEDFHNQFDI